MLSINGSLRLVDISHEIPAGDIRTAAFLLLNSYCYFPRDTVHLVVVDPGVGSKRKMLCVKSSGQYFVAPDNGCLSPMLQQKNKNQIRQIKNTAYFASKISPTFHGRDILAPVAARLAKGKEKIFLNTGPLLKGFVTLSWPRPIAARRKLFGEVLWIDRFGNVITNIHQSDLMSYPGKPKRCRLGSKMVQRWVRYYSKDHSGELIALINSMNHVEISLFMRSAAQYAGAKIGMRVVLEW